MNSMKTENLVLMQMAKESLKGKWGVSIAVVVVLHLIMTACQIIPFLGIIMSLLINGPIMLGLAGFFLSVSRGKDPKFEDAFEGFNNFGMALGAYVLMCLYIFLWSLLFIIPGIIAALSYAMVFYILAEDDSIGATDALKRSKEMMEGNKLKLFYLGLRFFGWGLLCILTCGIGFLWLIPYMQVTIAKFYDDIKPQEEIEIESEFEIVEG